MEWERKETASWWISQVDKEQRMSPALTSCACRPSHCQSIGAAKLQPGKYCLAADILWLLQSYRPIFCFGLSVRERRNHMAVLSMSSIVLFSAYRPIMGLYIKKKHL